MLSYKTTTSRDTFIFTWGGKGLFRRGGIPIPIVAEIYGASHRLIYPHGLDPLPEGERGAAILDLVQHFGGEKKVLIYGHPGWLPASLEHLVIPERADGGEDAN
jgi:hypothetical protein